MKKRCDEAVLMPVANTVFEELLSFRVIIFKAGVIALPYPKHFHVFRRRVSERHKEPPKTQALHGSPLRVSRSKRINGCIKVAASKRA